MRGTRGQFTKKPMFGIEHLGGKKFSQFGAEYVHNEKEAGGIAPAVVPLWSPSADGLERSER
jgi:hypothetical protein